MSPYSFTAGGAAIRAEGLVRRFGDVRAVDGIDLAVHGGEIYGFLGPNGAGKSTTVRMLCTLLHPDEGRAFVAGFDVVEQSDQVRLRIGLALQEAALDPKLTGRELLVLQGRYYGLRRDEIADRITHLRDLVDIDEAIDRPIGTYSGGMKRRLDLAAALIHNPDVLFLDEPTTGLDPVTRTRVWDEVQSLNTELGMTPGPRAQGRPGPAAGSRRSRCTPSARRCGTPPGLARSAGPRLRRGCCRWGCRARGPWCRPGGSSPSSRTDRRTPWSRAA
jgi:ABC-2 type transport system ATP-binding protein